MYIYLGNEKTVRSKDVLGIFDMDSSTVSSTTRKYLAKKQIQRKLVMLGDDIPKSFIIMKDGTVYLSQYNSSVFKNNKY